MRNDRPSSASRNSMQEISTRGVWRSAIVGWLLLILLGAGRGAAASPPRPNILVIVADDLGYGELGCQGFTKDIPTPHIDSIAKNGVRFTSGYVSGPYCSPTRAGFMTGRYQQRFGHEFNAGPPTQPDVVFGLSLKEQTIGDRLKAAGYATGWFGKSHLGHEAQFHPLRRGFDEFFGFLGAGHTYLGTGRDGGDPILRGTEPVERVDYLTDAFGREAAAFIQKHRNEPWFCYLAFNAVHSPLEATDKYLRRFPAAEDPKRRTFSAMLSAADDAVGAVLAKIRALGQEENTFIFFFSDNGGITRATTSGNGPLRGFKSETWEGGIRVPFLVQWPGRIPAGIVDDRPVIQLDILPTALAAAGVKVKPEWNLDGVNLLPYLTGKESGPPHKALYWRFGTQLALRMGEWKMVKGVGSKDTYGFDHPGKATVKDAELYNLARDMGEKNNLADQEPAKLKELAAMWEKWNGELADPAWLHIRDRAVKKAKQAAAPKDGLPRAEHASQSPTELKSRHQGKAADS